MRGFGEETYASDAAAAGLGGLYGLSVRNPAWPVSSNQSEFWLGAMARGDYGADAQNGRLIGGGRPEFFRARVPLPAGFRLGLGYTEWYSQDFDVYSESLPTYRRHITGQGGIYDLDAAIGKSFFGVANLSAEYAHLIGGSSELWEFDAYEGNYITFDTAAYTYTGNALRFGLSGGASVVSAALLYEQVLGLDAYQRVKTHGSFAESTTVHAAFPARFGGGIGVDVSPEFKVLADVMTQNAAQIKLDNALQPWAGNSLRVAGGVEYLMNERYPLRFGGRYQNWYLLATNGKPITEIGVTAGGSIPIKGFGSIDLALDYANRGTDALRENVLQLNFSLHYGETWKKRTQHWGY